MGWGWGIHFRNGSFTWVLAVPYHVSIWIGRLSVPMASYLASLRAKGLKQNDQAGAFHDLVFKTVYRLFYYFIRFIKIEPLSVNLAYTQWEGEEFPLLEGEEYKRNCGHLKNSMVHPLAVNY